MKFRDEESAAKALQALQGRFYAGRPILAEFSPVTDFREATCRQYEENTCSRGGYCNFMHLKPISRCMFLLSIPFCTDSVSLLFSIWVFDSAARRHSFILFWLSASCCRDRLPSWLYRLVLLRLLPSVLLGPKMYWCAHWSIHLTIIPQGVYLWYFGIPTADVLMMLDAGS